VRAFKGSSRAGELCIRGDCHGENRLGANSLADCSCSVLASNVLAPRGERRRREGQRSQPQRATTENIAGPEARGRSRRVRSVPRGPTVFFARGTEGDKMQGFRGIIETRKISQEGLADGIER